VSPRPVPEGKLRGGERSPRNECLPLEDSTRESLTSSVLQQLRRATPEGGCEKLPPALRQKIPERTSQRRTRRGAARGRLPLEKPRRVTREEDNPDPEPSRWVPGGNPVQETPNGAARRLLPKEVFRRWVRLRLNRLLHVNEGPDRIHRTQHGHGVTTATVM
jgi:hypothetical protein